MDEYLHQIQLTSCWYQIQSISCSQHFHVFQACMSLQEEHPQLEKWLASRLRGEVLQEESEPSGGETGDGCEGLSADDNRALGGTGRKISSGSSTVSGATQLSGGSSRSRDKVLRASEPRRTLCGEVKGFSRSSVGRGDGLGGTGRRTGRGASAGGSLLGLDKTERRSSVGLSLTVRAELSV